MTEGAASALTDQRKLIFITGASRSGTTLLSFVLRNHREVFGLKELQYFGQAWDPLAGPKRLSTTQALAAAATLFARQQHGILAPRVGPAERDAAAKLVGELGSNAADPALLYAAAVHGLTRAAGKTIPCEQTPRYIFYARELLRVYPAAHVVHIVRDPRAVMASQKMRWQLRQNAASGAAIPRYEALRVWVNYHPYTIARLWARATATALELSGHPRVTVLKFEDLLQQPEATVRELCSRLGLEYDARMLDVKQINSSHQSSVGGARGGLHASAIGKWREVLSPSEIGVTEQSCGQLMRRCAYELTAPAPMSLPRKLALDISYLAHLAGVLLVNPRRAYVQGTALFRSRSGNDGNKAAAETTASHDNPPG